MILIDAGPLVALVNADDQHHRTCTSVSMHLPKPLGTVWPAFTEAMHLLELPSAQDALWEILDRRVVRLLPLEEDDLLSTRSLMRKYADRPMDLADAALVTVAEREGIHTIFTVDKKDFAIYRLYGRGRFTIIP